MHKPNIAKLHVDERCEYRLRRAMPWIFDKYCKFEKYQPQLGDLVAVYGKRNQCIGIGLYDANSPIRVRMLGKAENFSLDTIALKLQNALRYRASLHIVDDKTTGLRLLNGESEGLPGIVIDCYAQTWVMKIYAACWLPYLPDILSILDGYIGQPHTDLDGRAYAAPPERLILRFGRECADTYEKNGFQNASLALGNDDTPHADFFEYGAKFRAHVFNGQKTGFFLDQRDNRQLVRSLAKDKKVLDICCYSGGFSINAAIGGACEVWSLDGDKHALDLVDMHYALNAGIPNVGNAKHILQRSNMFDWLARAKDRKMAFDLIIADPPSFASSQAQIPAAEKAYMRLFAAAASCLKPHGQILCCSCSSHIGSEKFAEIVRRALMHKTAGAINYTALPPDHVAAFAEARYLKTWLVTVK